ncbi:hypothetical protein [Roseiconus lacunae]|uniref:hypothetical protein n=1 Tax=Roseiconus lacunae TaxID=2605694 RepID=UPI0011F2A1EA|nr:hypothetical protein [Roseiconus lacunae]
MLRRVTVPAQRPPVGHVRHCKAMTNVGLNADLVEVMIDNRAMIIALLDVAAPPASIKMPGFEEQSNPAAITACHTVARLLGRVGGKVTVWLPPPPGPVSRRGWEDTIKANSKHPGVIYLDENHTLNDRLVQLGVCTRPHRLDFETLRKATPA